MNYSTRTYNYPQENYGYAAEGGDYFEISEEGVPILSEEISYALSEFAEEIEAATEGMDDEEYEAYMEAVLADEGLFSILKKIGGAALNFVPYGNAIKTGLNVGSKLYKAIRGGRKPRGGFSGRPSRRPSRPRRRRCKRVVRTVCR